jgi:geranylgeranyl pyrophosphate synthase
MDPSLQKEFKSILADPSSTCETLMPFLAETDSIHYARSVAERQAQEAIDFAKSLPSSSAATSLRDLAEFVLRRTH